MRWTVRNVLALAVCAMWIITTLSSIITTNYAPLGAVTPVMLIVTGFLYGAKDSNGNGNGSKKSSKNDDDEDKWSHLP